MIVFDAKSMARKEEFKTMQTVSKIFQMEDKKHLICFEQLGFIEIFDMRNKHKMVYQYQHPTNEWIIDACPTGNPSEYLIAIYERGLEFIQFEFTPERGFKIKDGFQTTYFSFQKIHAVCQIKKD